MHLITRISVIGIAVTTAALIVLISAFNGIEKMVENLYSEFDANLIVTSRKGKTFEDSKTLEVKIKQFDGVSFVSKAIEEVVILKHEKKWINAKLYGVEEAYLKLAKVSKHIVDGEGYIKKKNQNFGIIGATLLDRLQGFIPGKGEFEVLTVYFPKRDAHISVLSNPFRTELIQLSGRINYNKEVNEETIIVPLEFAQEMLGNTNSLTAIYVNLNDLSQLENKKEELQQILGNEYEVKTFVEKNKIIYQTSKSEKLIVIFILIFVFILALFNLVASLTMIYVEKKQNMLTLRSFGFDANSIFKTYFFQACLIAMKGIVIGLTLGFLIVAIQYFGELIILPNSNNQAFPVKITFMDSIFVFGIVTIISILASYLTVLFLIKNQNQQER